MVGVIGENGGRAVKLFGQHRPGEQMRPGCAAKRPQHVRITAFFIAVPVRSAQHKARFAHAIIAPSIEQVRDIARRKVFALLVEQNRPAVLRRARGFAACLGQFTDFERPSNAAAVARNQLAFGRAAYFAACNNMQLDGL